MLKRVKRADNIKGGIGEILEIVLQQIAMDEADTLFLKEIELLGHRTLEAAVNKIVGHQIGAVHVHTELREGCISQRESSAKVEDGSPWYIRVLHSRNKPSHHETHGELRPEETPFQVSGEVGPRLSKSRLQGPVMYSQILASHVIS